MLLVEVVKVEVMEGVMVKEELEADVEEVKVEVRSRREVRKGEDRKASTKERRNRRWRFEDKKTKTVMRR